MLNIEQIDKIAVSRGLKKLSISTNPSWVDKNHQEGIELKANIIVPFWIKDGERIYKEPVSEPLTKTIEMINNATTETKKEAKNEKKDNKDVKELVKTEVIDALLPDILTPTLMTKWAQMSTTDRMLLFQKTPKDKIRYVKVGKDAAGKEIEAPYVEGNYMFREANAAFLFDWHLDIIEVKTGIEGVSVRGILYAWFKEYNKYLSRPATGYQETNKKVTPELANKGATTDAIKKGLSLFGFNSDVYSGEV